MANPIKAFKVIKKLTKAESARNTRAVKRARATIASNSVKVKGKPSSPTTGKTGPMSKRDLRKIKVEKKANARGLKAANKIKSGSKSVAQDKEKNNYRYWDKAYNQFADHTGKERGSFGISTENALKLSKPARPNRVRGGSMRSKLNWPKGMK